jgi:hypothetical protein
VTKRRKNKRSVAAAVGIPIPDGVAALIRQTLVGQLRLRLAEVITGKPNVAPTVRQILQYLRNQSTANDEVGKVDLTLFFGKHFLTTHQEWTPITNIPALLEQLEDEPWDEFRVLEIHGCPSPLPGLLGAVAWDSNLIGGGKLYVVTILDAHYPDSVLAHLEIRASRAQPDHTFSIFAPPGYMSYTLVDVAREPWIMLALQCLQVLHTAHPDSTLISAPFGTLLPTSATDSTTSPPPDPEYSRRLRMVRAKKMPCRLVSVPLSSIRPYSADFALDVPKQTVERVCAALEDASGARMLLYWGVTSFIVSDDYVLYLAERSRGTTRVEAVVLGDVPAGSATIIRNGGAELIPGPLFLRDATGTPEYAEWVREYRRASKPPSDELIRLHFLYIDLARLLQEPWIRERDIHNFLFENPIVLDAYGADVMTEVCLAKDYRIDLVLQYSESDRRILVVELEPPSLRLFNKAGRWDSKVTHAIQQVQDWMRWWREHPSDVPAPLDPMIPLHGLVVVGRDKDLDDAAKRRLLHNNHHFHDLQVITYDDLLRRLQRLMSALGF